MMGYYIVAISWGSNIGPLCGGFIIGSKLPSLPPFNPMLIGPRCGMEMAEMGQRHLPRPQFSHGLLLRTRNAFPPRT